MFLYVGASAVIVAFAYIYTLFKHNDLEHEEFRKLIEKNLII